MDVLQISTGSSLLSLGTLVKGVQSDTISSIPSAELLTISHNPTFVINMLSAPLILQNVYVMKVWQNPSDGLVCV